MSYLTQKTIKNNISFCGIALHSGHNVNVCIKPAEPDFGIVFKRVDLKLNNIIYPNFNNVTNTSLNTIPKSGSAGLMQTFTLTPLCKAIPLKEILLFNVF